MAEEHKDSKRDETKECMEAFYTRLAKLLNMKKPEDSIKIKKVFELEENKK